MNDDKDSRQTLKKELQSLDVGEPEPPLQEAFNALSVSEDAAPSTDTKPEVVAADDKNRESRDDCTKARQGKQAN